MKKQIFISYSRKDLAVVEPFVKEIEARTGLRCWIDWTGIESGDKFEKKIVEAINQVDVVLFFLSDNSMASDYTEMEISYAYNTKKRVVPVMLDGGQLRGWFLFKFGLISFIDCNESRQVDTLMSNLVTWCGGCVPQPKPQPVKTYKVGDYFDDGEKQGVVFEVSEDGRHGKIVSLVESELSWSIHEERSVEKKIKEVVKKIQIGAQEQSEQANQSETILKTMAISESDGMYNQRCIEKIADWRTVYPAFAWCADLGEGWYLPAFEEVKKFVISEDDKGEYHTWLKRIKEKRFGKRDAGWYWSSTECDEFNALCVHKLFSYSKDGAKCYNYTVRAVAVF